MRGNSVFHKNPFNGRIKKKVVLPQINYKVILKSINLLQINYYQWKKLLLIK